MEGSVTTKKKHNGPYPDPKIDKLVEMLGGEGEKRRKYGRKRLEEMIEARQNRTRKKTRVPGLTDSSARQESDREAAVEVRQETKRDARADGSNARVGLQDAEGSLRGQLGLPGMEETAIFSRCRTWRYTLNRRWSEATRVVFLLCNPSTADEAQDDPTLRRCRGFAQSWGYGGLTILNLFAIRGTDPRILARVEDPVGPENDAIILRTLEDCQLLVCAWGCGGHMKGELRKRPATVVSMIRSRFPYLAIGCLGYTADGTPRHPLMLKSSTTIQYFEVKE